MLGINLNTKGFLMVLGFVMQQYVYGQEREDLRHCVDKFYKCDFYISQDDDKIKYEDTLYYSWYKSKKVHTTQGHSEGNILDGLFSRFYHSGQLAEQGNYVLGLKDGQWKTWYESGLLKTIVNYDEGVLNGDFSEFSVSGEISKQGTYRKGNLHGEYIDIPSDTKTNYKNGEEIVEKTEKNDDLDTTSGLFKRLFGKKDSSDNSSAKKNKDEDKKKEKAIEKEKVEDEENVTFWKRIFYREEKSEKPQKEKKEKCDD